MIFDFNICKVMLRCGGWRYIEMEGIEVKVIKGRYIVVGGISRGSIYRGAVYEGLPVL